MPRRSSRESGPKRPASRIRLPPPRDIAEAAGSALASLRHRRSWMLPLVEPRDNLLDWRILHEEVFDRMLCRDPGDERRCLDLLRIESQSHATGLALDHP